MRAKRERKCRKRRGVLYRGVIFLRSAARHRHRREKTEQDEGRTRCGFGRAYCPGRAIIIS